MTVTTFCHVQISLPTLIITCLMIYWQHPSYLLHIPTPSSYCTCMCTLTLTSSALGGATWISSITNGFLASQAIAARHVITYESKCTPEHNMHLKEFLIRIIYYGNERYQPQPMQPSYILKLRPLQIKLDHSSSPTGHMPFELLPIFSITALQKKLQFQYYLWSIPCALKLQAEFVISMAHSVFAHVSHPPPPPGPAPSNLLLYYICLLLSEILK